MKKHVILILGIAAVVISLGFASSQPVGGEVIMIRAIIVVTGRADLNTIKIYRGSAPAEIVQIGEKVNSKESFDEGVSKVIEVVNKYTSNGYEIVAANEFGGGASVIFNYTLRKL